MISRRCAASLLVCTLLSACAAPGPYFGPAHTSQVINANYAAADQLVAASQRPLAKNAAILVATLVRLEQLNASSNLGRLISEQIASRLTQLGYSVPEMKLRGSILVRSDLGELLLTRDVNQIAASHHAQAIVVGTYAVGMDVVYLHIELVDATTGRAISAYDYFLPMIGQVKVLLGLKPD